MGPIDYWLPGQHEIEKKKNIRRLIRFSLFCDFETKEMSLLHCL